MGYKSTKLPSYVLDSLYLVSAKLMTELERLPKDVVDPDHCPSCGSILDKRPLRRGLYIAECRNCGWRQPCIKVNEIRSPHELAQVLNIGVTAGLGLAALYKIIKDKVR